MLSVCARCLAVRLGVSFCARQLRLSMPAIKKLSLCVEALFSVIYTHRSGFRCLGHDLGHDLCCHLALECNPIV